MTLKEAAKSSRGWMIDGAIHFNKVATLLEDDVTELISRVVTISHCLDLDDEAVTRMRCMPGAFSFTKH